VNRGRRAAAAAATALSVALLAGCGGVTPIRTSFNKGVYQSSQGNHAGAVREYRAALEEEPADFRARFNLAAALEDVAAEKRRAAARAEAAGKSSEAGALKAEAEAARTEARTRYGEVLATRPDDLRSLCNLAAMDLEAHPDVALPARALATRALAQGRIADARTWAERAVAADASDAESQFALGRVREAEGDLERAREAYDVALKNEPDDVATLLAIGRLERTRARAAAGTPAGDAARTEALIHYRRAAMARRDVYDAHLALAELESEAGDDESAVAHLLAARRLDDVREAAERPDYEARLAALYERLAAKARGAATR
jgi:tetratricopeptide (TPR) repeat protein